MKKIIEKAKDKLNLKDFKSFKKLIVTGITALVIPIAFILVVTGLIMIQGVEFIASKKDDENIIDI